MEVWDGLTNSRITFDWNETNSFLSQQAPSSQTIAYMIENLNLTTGLQKFLAELGGVTIISPEKVESINYGPATDEVDLSSWPTVTVSSGRRLAARLLVGADGANSPVRTFAGIQARGWQYGRMGVVATIQLDSEPLRKIAYQRFLTSGPIAMLPLPGKMASLVWSTTPERAQVLKSASKEDFVALVNAGFRLESVDIDYLHKMSGGQAEEYKWRSSTTSGDGVLPTLVKGVQDGSIAPFPLRMQHADIYTADRIALVG
jgi:ubiquinone biosynthesis monooxygenase Coq6